ncbi:MAG: hypothetical protein MJE68_16270 [Proteobacteria bacterium]|nr:hypothetical protein [Pseudomonadota bacterium]
MPYTFLHSIEGNLILQDFSVLTVDLRWPVLEETGDGASYPNQEIRRLLPVPLSHIFNHIPLVPEREGPAIVRPQMLEQNSQVCKLTTRGVKPDPIELIGRLTFEGSRYLRHQKMVLIVIAVVSDDTYPAPKGTGHIGGRFVLAMEVWQRYLVGDTAFLPPGPSLSDYR